MREYLKSHLEQITKLIDGLKRDNIDFVKLSELDKSLELLSHKIKTIRLETSGESAEIYKQTIRQDAVLYFNNDFQVQRYAGTFENIFGKRELDSLPHLNEFFDPEQFGLLQKKAELLFQTNSPQSFDTEIILSNDIRLPVNILLEKVNISDGPQLVAAGLVFYEQTPADLKDYQDILIENLPDIDVYLFDNRFRHVLAGGREKERMKLTNADFTGRTLFDVYDEKTQKRLFPFYKNAIEGKLSEGEVRIKKQIYFVSATPVFNYNNQVVGGALIAQNVTKKKEIEKNLIRAKREAEEADKTKSVFLANMSHEIRTPLNAIIGFTELLEKTELNEKQVKFTRLINQSSEHLLSVVNEILFLFKLGMGKIFIEKVPFNVRNLIENVHGSLHLHADEKNLDFTYEIHSDVPEILIGDPYRIKQILINLTSNAIKFTDQGKVAIQVNMERASKKKVHLRFEVVDTGIGISKYDLRTIFDEFAQSSLTTERSRSGTGLGLTIARKLVELLKGRLHVESELNQGSKFSVAIPFEIPQNEEPVLPERDYELNSNLLEGKRILYADDDENNILLADYLLTEWKTSFEIARNGAEAMEHLLKEKFDIILLDIHMPELSGVEVVKRVRKSVDGPNKHTKMLAVTANILESDIKQYLKSGFNGHILKPFREAKLYSKICNMLQITHGIKEFKGRKKIDKKARPDKGKFEFDTTMLQESTKGNAEFYNKMLGIFVDNAEQTIKSFSINLKEKQWDEIGEKAHKAIPSFKYFGLNEQVKNLAEIEYLALRKKKYKKIPPLVEQSIKDINNLIPQVKKAKLPDGND